MTGYSPSCCRCSSRRAPASLDLDLRRLANGTCAEVREGHRLRLARVDQVDRLRLHDRALRLWIVSVTWMLTSWKLPESWTVTANARSVRRRDRVHRSTGDSFLPPGSAFVVDDVRAVEAASASRRSRRRGCAASTSAIACCAVEVAVRDEMRLGHGDAADALVLSTCDRRRLEEVVPDDVARDQPVGLVGERAPRRSSFFEPRSPLNASASPCDAAHAELERLDQVQVLVAQLARRVELLRGRARSAAPARRCRAACCPARAAFDARCRERVRDRLPFVVESCSRSSTTLSM